MKNLIDHLNTMAQGSLGFESLGDFIFSYDWSSLDYRELIPGGVDKGYSRHVLQMEPIEVVLLRWPPGESSAIHLHSGFYGYVVVLEGNLDNLNYSWNRETLEKGQTQRAFKGGILPEANGVIHELRNSSTHQEAVTLHIYYPPLENFDGMYIFDTERRRIGVLNEKAKSSSWEEPEDHFRTINEEAFMYQHNEGGVEHTHEIVPVVPKLDDELIYHNLNAYYAEQAKNYDQFDLSKAKRKKFVSSVNQMIADEIQTYPNQVQSLLGLACGTARRLSKIRDLSGVDYAITGVEPSLEMSLIAASRGVAIHNSRWLTVDLGAKQYDVVTMLYAFGHFCCEKQRMDALTKVYEHLNPGGWFFLDVFNLDDQFEWGPEIRESHQNMRLSQQGYDLGDVFYRKINGNGLAFLHYFTRTEIIGLLKQVGFDIQWVKVVGYAKNTGMIRDNDDEGILFIKAIKPK